ncbi:hypothetical protein [Bradyrhizobium sp. CCGUVB23]|uniref:hypothetical protein n=1 Tax=Bradyrhizobium sp. CCGUVB23 TaxID=2949630 RepID=UPI0020B39B24|nr:hypothetical protein [Bradyrhizobium sp. CCGUVB23]MCP3460431.1 hypothetical protein [Bradyrhizobium sp. CCGUVB23]
MEDFDDLGRQHLLVEAEIGHWLLQGRGIDAKNSSQKWSSLPASDHALSPRLLSAPELLSLSY